MFKIKGIVLAGLTLLAGFAVYAGITAARSLRHEGLVPPDEIYSAYAERVDPEYYLRDHNGFVAVYKEEKDDELVAVTGIELSGLRTADRAMIEKGIPVLERLELLELLEDLGS